MEAKYYYFRRMSDQIRIADFSLELAKSTLSRLVKYPEDWTLFKILPAD